MRFTPFDSLRAPTLVGVRLVTVLAMLALAGCSKDKTTNPNPNPGPGSTTYTGSVAGATTSGKLTVTLATGSPAPQEVGFRAHATITATGTFTPSGGAAVTLTGTYDDVTKIFSVTGGGWTFSGSLTSLGLVGSFTGPGPVSGVFSLQLGGTGVTVIVGTFTSTTSPPGDNGVFNFSLSGSTLNGNAVTAAGDVVPLNGTYNSSTGAISIVNPGNPTGPALATGYYNSTAGTASGMYDTGAGESGTWMGAKQ